MTITTFMLCSCTNNKFDNILSEIDDYTLSDPQKALHMLDSLNIDNSDKEVYNYFILLKVKAKDKADKDITSDDEIFNIAKEYDSNSQSLKYIETLYYCGRVSKEMGDYPTALKYYQEALTKAESCISDDLIIGNIYSQLSQVYKGLRLYPHATEYIDKSITLDKETKDYHNLILDLEFKGLILFNQEKYSEAEHIMNQVKALSDSLFPQLSYRQQVFLAGIKYHKGSNDSALNMVRGLHESRPDYYPDQVLYFATLIYKKAGIIDTAYMYAHKLANIIDAKNRVNALYLLTKPEFKPYVKEDSLRKYAELYSELSQNYMKENGDREALIQNSIYNYSIHVKERHKAEKQKATMIRWIFIIVLFFACLSIILLCLNLNRKKQIIKLHNALQDTNKSPNRDKNKSGGFDNVGEKCHSEENQAENPSCATIPLRRKFESDEEYRLRVQLLTQLQELLYIQNTADYAAPIQLINSDVYRQLVENIEFKRSIAENSEIWEELDREISLISPNFKRNLKLLMGSRLNQNTYHMAMLIKCAIPPIKIAILMSRARNSISSKRSDLCKAIFGDNRGTHTVDRIIQVL